MPELIGELNIVKPVVFNHEEIKQMLKSNIFETIKVNNCPYAICTLPNGTLACSFTNFGAGIFDKELKLIKSTHIDEKDVSLWSISTNNKDRIFFADVKNHQIIMTDLELNRIKCVGSQGDGILQFSDPRVAYYKNRIFVAEHINKRIQVLNDSLDFIKMHELDYCPRYIQVANNTALISSYSPAFVAAYDIESFQLEYEYRGHNGSLSILNSFFYEYGYDNSGKFFCYNENGVLIEEIQTTSFDGQIGHSYDGSLQIFNKTLICSSYRSGKLFKMKKQSI